MYVSIPNWDSFSEDLPYGRYNEGTVEAVNLLARTHGISLDPVYNGKSMSWLTNSIRRGSLEGKNVLFLYTGSYGNFFDYLRKH
jgi:1-aminocyclopropane-1-carboxylate deaminase/D-cysteine desulfhydrase-like pyridoxal-dependent ACC family enzyme